MTTAASIPVRVTVRGQVQPDTTLGQFLSANTDIIDPLEAEAISCIVGKGSAYTCDSFRVERAPEPRSGRPAGALPTATAATDPVYLLHSSPLRACVVALGPTAGAEASSVEACRYGPQRLPRVLCRLGGAWFPLSASEARNEARHLLVNDGGPTDPASELANHVAGGLIAAADTLDAALAAEQQAVLTAGRAA